MDEHLVPEVPVERGGVVLALAHLEVDVRRLVGAVLGDDQARPHHVLALAFLEHEEVFALERVLHLSGEAAHRDVDELLQRLLVVGEIDGVEHRRQPFEAGQVRPLDVAQKVHGLPGEGGGRGT